MSKDQPDQINWLDRPEEHNYPAAASYLALLYPPKTVDQLVDRLRHAKMSAFKAKDIFRASGLSLLGISNGHVAKDQKKIKDGKRLSPLLLIVDTEHGRVVVADGYHRLCAVYTFDEDALIPCQIA